MKRVGQVLTALTWILVVSSMIIIAGGMFGRPLLLAAVPTGSMVPILQPGDLIVVLPTWVMPEPKNGDIVVYKTAEDKNWIVHRVIDGDSAEGYLVKGDANPVPDPHRVFPRDIAGVVPHWSGGALRLPRLGLLSLSRGPLSNPIAAGVALVMGLVLLAMDVQPLRGVRRLRLRRHTKARPAAIATMYLGLAGVTFLTTLAPAWMLSSRQLVRYQVVEERPANVLITNQYIKGVPHEEELAVPNTSALPLVVGFVAEDKHISYSPAWAIIPAHGKVVFTAHVDTPATGKFQSTLYTGVFMPLLPPALLVLLARVNIMLAATATAAVPALGVIVLALLDVRSRMVFYRWRIKLLSH